MLDGIPDQVIADRYGATREGVTRFKIAHSAELVALDTQRQVATRNLWITDEHQRQSQRQSLYEDTDRDRTALPQSHGLRAAFIREQRGILNDAEPPVDKNVVNNIVIVRSYEGLDTSDALYSAQAQGELAGDPPALPPASE